MSTLSVPSVFGYRPEYSQLNLLSLPVTFNALNCTQELLTNGITIQDFMALASFIRFVGGAGTLQAPTAASLVAAMPGCVVGTAFYLPIINSSGGTLTMTTNTGTTLSGTVTTAVGFSKIWLTVVTSNVIGAEAVTMYSLGSKANS